MNLIHSTDIPEPYINALTRIFSGLIRISIPRSDDVYTSIGSHPDIFIFAADKNTFIYASSLPEKLIGSIEKNGVNLTRSQTEPYGRYPETAVLNAVRVGRHIFHNLKYTDTTVKTFASDRGLRLIHVNQGYARCSTIPVNEGALITCDPGIAKAAKEAMLDALLISQGNVLLPGEKYGFIGGAAGITPDDQIVFLGDIQKHTDYNKIDLFLGKHNVRYRYLEGLPLFDAGSLIFTQ